MSKKLIATLEKRVHCPGCYELWCILIWRRLWRKEARKGRGHIMPREWNPDHRIELKRAHVDKCKVGRKMKGRTHV